jgi:cytochrome P450
MAAQTILSLVFLALLTFVLLRRRGARRSGNGVHHRLPPSPPGLPVIGHLHMLGSNPHISLREIAGRHGAGDGFMLLRLGQVPALVVSSPRAAEAVLRSHDHAFASRPPSAVADILLSYSDVALAPYGDYWRLVRRLVTTHVLSASKVQSLRRARQEEVALVVGRVRGAAAAASATAVDMTELFSVFTNDVVCRAVLGRFFRRVDGRHSAFQEIINSQVVLIAGFNLDDCFPCLARVGVLARVLFAKVFSLKKKWDVLLDEIITEHAAKLASAQEERRDKVDDDDGQMSQEEDDADFVHVLLSLQQEYRLTRQQVKSILVVRACLRAQ